MAAGVGAPGWVGSNAIVRSGPPAGGSRRECHGSRDADVGSRPYAHAAGACQEPIRVLALETARDARRLPLEVVEDEVIHASELDTVGECRRGGELVDHDPTYERFSSVKNRPVVGYFGRIGGEVVEEVAVREDGNSFERPIPEQRFVCGSRAASASPEERGIRNIELVDPRCTVSDEVGLRTDRVVAVETRRQRRACDREGERGDENSGRFPSAIERPSSP